ncbi:Receptor-like serine/threonine-protein kinase [Heracleum sosnowskyi]|uniref:Receptor-like serine/threonine-protein kinase n=1 Tax=Heracleum sosnowskyi TaxID=360622 RepID=A0AAD8IRV2_9APIA|nr:Receptor-like serine/threonine-protein kinase [Heracleum sosnowskyi]
MFDFLLPINHFPVPLGFKISGFDSKTSLVSKNGVFAFGFLEKDGFDSDGLLVGVRYNIDTNVDTKAGNVPVWTVGGGLKVSLNSTFMLDMDGKLILINDLDGLVVWSSNTSNLGIEKASLLNNGNFVLVDSEGKIVWESFNSPTSTLVPGQALGFSQTLRAPSTKSTTSYYSFVIRESGELVLLWEHNVTYWRSGLRLSVAVKEARFDEDGVLGVFDEGNKMVWSTSSKDFRDPNVKLRHLRIDQDGNLRMYSWDNFVQTWRVGWQAVENQCTVFGACGLYSVCGFNTSGPVCDCLFSDSNEWATGAPATDFGNSGCKKMIDLSNCKMRTSMLVMKQTVLYGLYPPHDVDLMLGQEACREYCSNDTTCIAATSKNDGSGLCTVKRTSFISGYQTPSVPSTSYLKACFVPQAVSARGANPHGDAGSISLPPSKLGAERGSSKKFVGTIVIIILGTLLVIMILQMFAFWFLYKRRQTKAGKRIPFGKDDQMNPHYSALIRLSYEEIQELTSNFANQLGPSVFKGQLSNKSLVIAKVINNPVISEKEFRVAVSSLGRTHHRNLVSLTGFCFETKHKIILFEYIPNGSLDNYLFNVDHDKGNTDWQHRLDIAIGIARGIAYLHSECQQCIIHGNLKVENVLLDEKLLPKLTNFGLFNLMEGAATSESSPEKDIYMLGEILLQIVLCKRNIAVGQQVLEQLNKEKELYEIEDSRGVERVVRIALWCMQSQPFLRPSIGEVVKVLEGTLSVDSPSSVLKSRHESTMEEEAVEKIEIEAA